MLDVSHNCLESVSPGLTNLSALEELNLSHNLTKSLSGSSLHQLANLRVPNLQNNQWKGFVEELCELKNVEVVKSEL